MRQPLAEYRIAEQYGTASWAGAVLYRCFNREARAVAQGLFNQVMPGHSVAGSPPRCRRTRIRYNARPGIAFVTAYYRSSREPGVARLAGRLRPKAKKILRDLAGNVIEGPVDPPFSYRRLVSGSNLSYDCFEELVVQTAAETLNLQAARDRRFHVNSGTLVNLGNAPRGSLLFVGLRYKKEYTEGSLWYLDYHFLVNPNGWNTNIKSEGYTRVAVRVPVFEMTTGMGGAFPPDRWDSVGERTILTDVRGHKMTAFGRLVKDDGVTDHVVYPEANFSDLAGMIRW